MSHLAKEEIIIRAVSEGEDLVLPVPRRLVDPLLLAGVGPSAFVQSRYRVAMLRGLSC